MRVRYKDFVWEQEPDSLSIRSARDLKRLCVPGEAVLLQDMGCSPRVVEGKGSFLGKDCLCRYHALAMTFADPTPGLLALPETPPFLARFASLELLAKSFPNTVEYRFSFWEEGAPPVPVSAPAPYVCRGGENLWEIAARYGVDPDEILKNSFVQWPGRLKAGEVLHFSKQNLRREGAGFDASL